MVTTITLPQNTQIDAALAGAIAEANENAKRLAQLNRAAYDLLVLRPQIVRISGAYLMPSTSRGGIIHRVDDLNGCDCEAGRKGTPCRHVAALELIERCAMRPSASDAEYAKACADMDELFA